MGDSNAIIDEPSSPAIPMKRKQGFAMLAPEQVRELARRGGEAAHRAGTAHEFTTDEARAAGRKGGIAAHATPKASRAERQP
jgi:general stress protein YciG